jgi:hypothetical protein
MSSYPSPCLKCTKEICREKECLPWKIRYLYRQKQINAYAKRCGLTVQKKGGAING